MAMIRGHDGTVTFAAGYTTLAHAWRATIGGETPDKTAFTPPGDARVVGAAINDWEGEYRCWQQGTVSTNLTLGAGFYSTNAHAYSIELVAEALPSTPFGANWNTYLSGLLAATGNYECYIDTVTVLPTRGNLENLTLTIDVGKTYVMPIVIGSVEARVSADGSDRHLTVNWASAGDIVETGVPTVGAAGAAELIADGGRKYTGNILITRIGINMTALKDVAEWTFGFKGNGICTPS